MGRKIDHWKFRGKPCRFGIQIIGVYFRLLGLQDQLVCLLIFALNSCCACSGHKIGYSLAKRQPTYQPRTKSTRTKQIVVELDASRQIRKQFFLPSSLDKDKVCAGRSLKKELAYNRHPVQAMVRCLIMRWEFLHVESWHPLSYVAHRKCKNFSMP